MAKENASNHDFQEQFGFPFAPFNVPGFGSLPQIYLGASFASGDKKVVANWIKKVNARKSSLAVTRWGWDAAAAQGFVIWLGLNWAGTGGMLGLAQPLALQPLLSQQSHPKPFPVGRLPPRKLLFHCHISALVHLQGLVQSCWGGWGEGRTFLARRNSAAHQGFPAGEDSP